MAKASAYLLGGGGLLGIATLAVPGSATRNELVVLAICLAALTIAAVALAAYDRLSAWFFHLTPAATTGLMACGFFFAGGKDNASPVFSLLVVLYALGFLSVRAAAFQIGLIVALLATVAVLRPGTVSPDNALITLAVVAGAAYMLMRSNRRLKNTIHELTASKAALHMSREETIQRLSLAVEFRDVETGRHLARMSEYCALLARRLGVEPERIELIRVASLLHDIGKIGIPERILRKAGPLTHDEVHRIRSHTDLGHRLLADSGQELLELAATIARTHHERYDGSGYPQGLEGEAIPLEGRIAAVADVFDALTTTRTYRPPVPVEDAMEILRKGRGTQFDAVVVDAFLDANDEVLAIIEQHGEATAPAPVVAIA